MDRRRYRRISYGYKRKNPYKGLMLVVTVLLLLVVLAGVAYATDFVRWENGTLHVGPAALATPPASETIHTPIPSASATPTPTPEPTPVKLGTRTVSMHAVGDIMCHDNQLASAKMADGSYDFNPWFENIKDELMKADIVLGNLETTLSGAQSNGYTGYPMFNTPDSLLDALKGAGFTALTTANNHSLDRRIAGLKRTIEQLDAAALWHTGTFASQVEKDTLPVIEKNDIKMAVLNYTFGCNGVEEYVPAVDLAYAVNLMKRDQILKDVRGARAGGVDFVIVALHWGTEYVRQPSSDQRTLAEDILMAGADVILGSHPHMIQPITRKTITDEAGRTREVVVAYSMGNFVSDQRAQYKDTGLMVRLGFEKNLDTGVTKISEVGYMPTWVYRYQENNQYQYRILPAGLYAANEALRATLGTDARSRVQAAWSESVSLVGETNITAFRSVP